MKNNRKKFLQQAATGLLGILSASPLFAQTAGETLPVVMHAGEGETFWIGGRNSPLTIKVAKDLQGNASMSFCQELIAPGEGIPLHKHLNEDELIFIHRGEGLLELDGRKIPVKEGSVALVPKGIWHSMTNIGKETIVMVFSYSPAGFEGYFREFGSPEGTPWKPKSQKEYDQLNKKWGIVYA